MVLSAIDPQSIEPFDFIFIDADKQGYPEYLELSLKFSKSGTIIVLDNVIRAGDILNPENKKPSIEGIRETFKALENHPQIFVLHSFYKRLAQKVMMVLQLQL